MKKYPVLIACLLIATLFIIGSCKKSSSAYDFNTGMTATFNGQTAKYITPSGLVNEVGYYDVNGYESDSLSNTILLHLGMDTVILGTYTLSGTAGDYVQIVNNGITYANRVSGNITGQITITNKTLTGTFSGTLQSTTSSAMLVVTNGTISTIY